MRTIALSLVAALAVSLAGCEQARPDPINALENEKYDPSLPLAFRIAALFHMRIEDIFRSE